MKSEHAIKSELERIKSAISEMKSCYQETDFADSIEFFEGKKKALGWALKDSKRTRQEKQKCQPKDC